MPRFSSSYRLCKLSTTRLATRSLWPMAAANCRISTELPMVKSTASTIASQSLSGYPPCKGPSFSCCPSSGCLSSGCLPSGCLPSGCLSSGCLPSGCLSSSVSCCHWASSPFPSHPSSCAQFRFSSSRLSPMPNLPFQTV